MTSFQQFITHLVTVVVGVAAGLILAVDHVITGATAIGLIAAVLGVSLGVGAVSIGAGTSSPQSSTSGPTSGPGTSPIP